MSMSLGRAKKPWIHESKTVWNYSLCPGWTPEEAEVLIILLKKFGIGKWTAICK